MKNMSFDIVTLNWEKATIDVHNNDCSSIPNASGLYQIYGTSPLYGMDTLLYLGKSHQLRHRIKQHFELKEGTIGRQPNKTCRFVLLDEALLDIVVQTLIAMHKPSFNSSRIINLSPAAKSKFIYIQNEGERGMLNIEVTNYYFLSKPEDFTNVIEEKD